MSVESKLIDARNWETERPVLLDKIRNADLIGFDIETFDQPHEGLAKFRGNNTTKVFDINRTVVTGFSLYCDGDDTAYYVNLYHADSENRLDWDTQARQLLDAVPEESSLIAHHATFELCMMWKSLGYWLGDNIICTMQMAVSAYGPDEYSKIRFMSAGLGGIQKLLPQAGRVFRGCDIYNLTDEQEDLIGKVTAKQSSSSHSYNGFVQNLAFGYGLKRAVKTFLGVDMQTFKETLGDKNHMGELTGEEVVDYGADDSYYAVKLFYALLECMKKTNPQVIDTFVNQENPMVPIYAELWATGMRVSEKGIINGKNRERAECARILRELKPLVREFLPFDNELNEGLYQHESWYVKNAARYRNKISHWASLPDCDSDFEQVMQVSGAVADGWNKEVQYTKHLLGPNFTHYMVMRTLIYDLLRERPMRENGKVQSDGENRGRLIERFTKRIHKREQQGRVLNKSTDYIPADSISIMRGSGWGNPYRIGPDGDRDEVLRKYKQYLSDQYENGSLIISEVADLWGYDLVCCCKPEPCHGDVLLEAINDAAERTGKINTPAAECDISTEKKKKRIVELINELAGVEQRMKLYLTPYSQLVDPNTGRVYPYVSSMLASRRMASENPNAMQLAKQGKSTYIRGFFLPDYDDHVLVSLDWSAIELVLIGELSGDPEFAKAYKQTPYEDLHLGAAVDGLRVTIPEISESLMKNLDNMSEEEVDAINPQILVDPNGRRMKPKDAKKFWRTNIGKGSNFNYWYSGALSTVAQRLGWTLEQMWKATENYRSRFEVAEIWRQKTIEYGQRHGYVTLPDGHRRVRYEATDEWWEAMSNRFKIKDSREISIFGYEVCKRIRKRAGNQLVNSFIQGTCATLAKRSIMGIKAEIERQGFDAVFKMPVHDELLWSVHKDQVVDFIHMAKRVMTDHPSIVSNLAMDATASVGWTFEPYDPTKAPYGQVEVDEPPVIEGVVPKELEKTPLPDTKIEELVRYMLDAG